MEIKFIPRKSDLNQNILEESCKEYAYFWKNNGSLIIIIIQNISELNFKTTYREATIFLADGKTRTCSHPLMLLAQDIKQPALLPQRRLWTLVHELIHILLSDNKSQNRPDPNNSKISFENHKKLYLVALDVYQELSQIGLLEQKFINDYIQLYLNKGDQIYAPAINYALKFDSAETRKTELKKLMS